MDYREASLESIVRVMRRLGVKRYRRGDVELELSDRPVPAQPSSNEEDVSEALGPQMPAEDDLMFWSAPGALPSEERESALKREPQP